MPKASRSKQARHDPLHVELAADESLRKFGRAKNRKSKVEQEEVEEPRTGEDARMSRKILELAREQQDEVANELGEDDDDMWKDEDDEPEPSARPRQIESDDDSDDEDGSDIGGSDEEHELNIDPEDHATMDALGKDEGQGKTLADLIFAQMDGAPAAPVEDDGPPDPRQGLNPKVVEVYTKVGYLLSRYKSGPLPKALKILPSMPQWAQLLAVTTPTSWTPHAAFACTKIFVSNLKPSEVRVFLEGVLLDLVREDMRNNHGKLNVHLYNSLKKALYKPAPFFKGILFPLCESSCSLKEAAIVASVLSKVSVPVLHSAAALMRLASMDYAGPNSLFIRILLDKKYALPYKVVDALVFHFIRLANSPRSRDGEDKLPVLWHQSLLVFVQRYGSDLTADQKDALLDVIRVRPHPTISAEIRREIVNSVERGAPRPDDSGDVAM
ncbi:protein required for pre-rRNA processing and 40S ribosomal subunit synthesis, Enp1p [Trichosporon asahii var. asahii CBS 8904]|uniref:Protein required for pre-rRNA processing and 40S ribosomal subunit synthesis, Enp1p n=1 Tax=Trichosporon asahii var. asahii (strain CBS 8904) TaxID=1220162 RepID=K1VFJ0_TRIAC|nr:protein required for pre-rRNA processing and 40S ribosomal subunit synthesis, Enp1p [Trichosporon asahii var. asahii CBS 8904]